MAAYQVGRRNAIGVTSDESLAVQADLAGLVVNEAFKCIMPAIFRDGVEASQLCLQEASITSRTQ